MNSNLKTVLTVLGAALVLSLLVALAIHFQNKLSSHLPPKSEYSDQSTAYTAARAWVAENAPNAVVDRTTGTPSMEPYIHGQNWVVVDPSVPYESIREDDCVVYVSHDAVQGIPDGELVLHVVAKIDSGGFIMAGINNVASESASRVTKADYRGKLLFVAAWPQP